MDAVADRLGSESDVARTRTVVMIGSDDEHGPVYVAGSPLSVFPGKIVPHGATSHSPPSSDQATPSSAESWRMQILNPDRLKRTAKLGLVEVWIPARAGKTSDVDERGDLVGE